jgi:hypothetical protein
VPVELVLGDGRHALGAGGRPDDERRHAPRARQRPGQVARAGRRAPLGPAVADERGVVGEQRRERLDVAGPRRAHERAEGARVLLAGDGQTATRLGDVGPHPLEQFGQGGVVPRHRRRERPRVARVAGHDS